MRIRRAVAGMLLMLACAAQAEALKSEADIRPYADNIMARVAKGDIAGAFTLIKIVSVLPAAELDATAAETQRQRDARYLQRYGKTLGFEFVGSKKIGTAVLRMNYIERAQKQPLRWNFDFYNTPEGWVMSGNGWDDRVAQLYEQQ